MNKTSIFAILFMVVTGLQCVVAQNPLRTNHELESSQIGQKRVERLPERPTQYVSNVDRSHLGFNTTEITTEIPPRIDMSLVPTSFEQIPNSNVVSNRNSPRSLTELNEGGFASRDHILKLIMKISLNLGFVLSFAVGVMLVVKRWIRPTDESVRKGRAKGDLLCVRETLRVDNRMTIRLVQWRSNRFLIASDQNGIQSVNALNAAFDQTLQELDGEQADNKTLERLIAGLNLD